ncbi:MAG TPA: DUF2892 domain-containing protein [Parachlamydiales bacterium]|nr:DUF2892 domain-containing protein [Parachlamydiales bacterium]
MKFSKNIGTADRIFRLLIAVLLLALAYWKSSWILLGASLFVFFESFVGWCILYQILGKSSCPVKKK